MSSTKSKTLAFLENNRGQYISGTNIAKELGVSRTAVWKAVKYLQKDGYTIEAVTQKGYCLIECPENDVISLHGIQQFLLEHKNKCQVYYFPQLKSTNDTAKEMALAGNEHGTVVIADILTDGKGRRGRRFFTQAGCGVYLSIILRPDVDEWNRLSTMLTCYAALAVCRALEKVLSDDYFEDKQAKIKWVNDVFLVSDDRRRKICGILTEAVTDFETGGVQWAVVGIGVNFLEPDGGFPEEIAEIAGALFSGGMIPTITRNQLAAEIINEMLGFSVVLETSEEPPLKEYKARLMMLGERVTVINANETQYEATALDIDESGGLVIRKDCGEVITLSVGEISVRIS
ncbi:MAG: biotin--[acetyl-CoA-carboxylase] ligase [Oscillospiraceae bacterium]|nr:biotin--[acetyl-CoA-carboxylase] ligase [Oscillospiraceae bacterium]